MSNTSAAIMARVFEPEAPTLTPETARSILSWTFRQDDRERFDVLSLKVQEGSLTPEERAELDEYLRVSNLLALLKSKARLSLKTAGVGA